MPFVWQALLFKKFVTTQRTVWTPSFQQADVLAGAFVFVCSLHLRMHRRLLAHVLISCRALLFLKSVTNVEVYARTGPKEEPQ
eukprot:scaffold253614_cov18-Tisochrysis_lutea.AAC.1